jgi:hypothetical protein
MRTTTVVIVSVAVSALTGLLVANASAKTIVVKKGGDLQSAIDGAAAGDTVLVKPGTYAPVTVTEHADLTIRGVGKVIVNGATAQNCVLLTDCRRVVVRGLTLKDSLDSALRATGCEESTVTRCTVLNAGNEGLEFSSCFKVLVDRNTIDTTEDDGIALSDGPDDQSRVSVVTRNKIVHASDGGIDVDGNGIDVRDDLTTVRSNVVEKNVVTKAEYSGIHVTGTSNEVTKNVIAKSGGVADLQDAGGGATNTYKRNRAKTLSPSDLSNPKK